MREIKFRAWDKELQKMWTNIEQEYDNQSIPGREDNWDVCSFAGYINDPNRDRYEVMQFTGLRDRNGVEIYEGDVLRWYPESDHAARNVVIEWVNGGFDFGGWYENDFPDTSLESEVIGNIYEGVYDVLKAAAYQLKEVE